MSKLIDARGLSCPQPVLLVLEALKSKKCEKLNVLVDNETSVENITRAAENRGFKIIVNKENQSEYNLTLEADSK